MKLRPAGAPEHRTGLGPHQAIEQRQKKTERRARVPFARGRHLVQALEGETTHRQMRIELGQPKRKHRRNAGAATTLQPTDLSAEIGEARAGLGGRGREGQDQSHKKFMICSSPHFVKTLAETVVSQFEIDLQNNGLR